MAKKASKELKRIFESKGLCSHPVSCKFEEWATKISHRVSLSFLLAFVTTLFSRIAPICTDKKCMNYFFQAVFNWDVLSNPNLAQNLLFPFFSTIIFFFLIWIVIISVAIWAHTKRWTHDLVVPTVIVFLIIFMLLATTGALPYLFLETQAIDCLTDEDCILAGYCGEVCVSRYQVVYTTFDPNCEPLESCACINNKCVGG